MITAEHIPHYISEDTPHRLTAFHSDLYDILPDARRMWPETIETTLGNRLPFVLEFVQNEDGETLYAHYVQSCGIISLRIFND